jgi:hypothetical protein
MYPQSNGVRVEAFALVVSGFPAPRSMTSFLLSTPDTSEMAAEELKNDTGRLAEHDSVYAKSLRLL